MGCGFYSYFPELIFMVFRLFIQLFADFQKTFEILELSLKWFLSKESTEKELVFQGGLKLTLYALK